MIHTVFSVWNVNRKWFSRLQMEVPVIQVKVFSLCFDISMVCDKRMSLLGNWSSSMSCIPPADLNIQNHKLYSALTPSLSFLKVLDQTRTDTWPWPRSHTPPTFPDAFKWICLLRHFKNTFSLLFGLVKTEKGDSWLSLCMRRPWTEENVTKVIRTNKSVHMLGVWFSEVNEQIYVDLCQRQNKESTGSARNNKH